MTVAESDHPCIEPVTVDPTLTRPSFQPLFRPAAASAAHVADATIFREKLPLEKLLDGDAGLPMPPHDERKISRATPACRTVVSAVKVNLAQAAGVADHT